MAVVIEANNGITIAFGLAWKQINAKTEQSDVAKLVRRHRASLKIKWTSGAVIRYGVASLPQSSRHAQKQKRANKKVRVLSGASIFASKVSSSVNSLLIFPVDAKHAKFAVVAIVEGAPYVDVVIPQNQVRERIESLRQEGHQEFVEYGDHPEFTGATNWDLEDFLGAPEQLTVMQKTGDRRPLAIKFGAAMAVVAICGGLFLKDYLKERDLEQQASVSTANPGVEYERKLAEILIKAGLSGEAALTAFWAPLADRSTSPEGAIIESVTCSRIACTELWRREGGTNESLSRLLPKGASFGFDGGKDTGDLMRVTYAPVVTSTPIKTESLPTKAAFWLAASSEAQRLQFPKEFIGELGPSFTPVSAKVIGIPAGIALSAIPKDLLVAQGSYTMTGPYSLLKEALLRTGSNMAVDEVAINISGGIEAAQFTIKGSYYVKD